MTVIAIKDGILACDSHTTFCCGGIELTSGNVKKFLVVDDGDTYPVGIYAGAGTYSDVCEILRAIDRGEEMPRGGNAIILHLNKDGEVRVSAEGAPFYVREAPFHAEGAGMYVAYGAMAYGASAIEAVQIACDLVPVCGGKIRAFNSHTLKEITIRSSQGENE